MPNIESAIKRVRTSENANVKNSSQTSAMRTAIKKFEDAVASGADNVDALYKEAVKAIDMAESILKTEIHNVNLGFFICQKNQKHPVFLHAFGFFFLPIDFSTTALCAKRKVENLILFRFAPF